MLSVHMATGGRRVCALHSLVWPRAENVETSGARSDPVRAASLPQIGNSDGVTDVSAVAALASAHGPPRLGYADGGAELVVYTARRIITMEPGLPTATAVAVHGDRIVAVGDLESMEPWLRAFPHRIDDRFVDRVMLPGFVEPHVHPFLGAVLLTFEVAAAEEWDLVDRVAPAVPDAAAYRERLVELVAAHTNPSEPLVVWGFLPFVHGELTRRELDEISPDAALFVIHRSFHAINANSRGLDSLHLTDAAVAEHDAHHVDLDRGSFIELGIGLVLAGLGPAVNGAEKLGRGLQLFRNLCHRGGVTTAIDALAGGVAGIIPEWVLAHEYLDADDVPFRTLFVAPPKLWRRRYGDDTTAVLQGLVEHGGTRRLKWLPAIKALADGAFISQAMHLSPPGYIDGHGGQWMQEPGELFDEMLDYWKAGWGLHVHVNGDVGLDAVLDVLERYQRECPQPDPRFVLHHLGISREDQIRRAAALGASASTNGYYLRYFGDIWAEQGIGPERADQMTRHGSLARHHVSISMHCDLPMAPIRPLLAVATAVTRQTAAGTVRGPGQAIDVDTALRAITIEPAWQYRLDHEIGSISVGKKADFTILDADPYDVDPETIGDITVIATIFEGEPHHIRR